jgi:hypothetical protein
MMTFELEIMDRIYLVLTRGNGIWNTYVPSSVCGEIKPILEDLVHHAKMEERNKILAILEREGTISLRIAEELRRMLA